MRNLYCIVGPSGCGKTVLANGLKEKFGLIQVKSHTTRPRRYPEEDGYYFVTEEEFFRVGATYAYAYYKGNHYGCTPASIEQSDIYVIEPEGARFLQEKYRFIGGKGIKVIHLKADSKVCANRMRTRGDSEAAIRDRIDTDAVVFADENINADIVYDTNGRDAEHVLFGIYRSIVKVEVKEANVKLKQYTPHVEVAPIFPSIYEPAHFRWTDSNYGCGGIFDSIEGALAAAMEHIAEAYRVRTDMSLKCGYKFEEMHIKRDREEISEDDFDAYFDKFCMRCCYCFEICFCGEPDPTLVISENQNIV